MTIDQVKNKLAYCAFKGKDYEGNDMIVLEKEVVFEVLDKLTTKTTNIDLGSNSKNLTLLETIENTKQLPQVQYDLQRQLRELRVMANKLGLYDAADFIKPYCG